MVESIGEKIQAYAQSHAKEIEFNEAMTGKKMGDFEIAQAMLKNKELSMSDFQNWMSTEVGQKAFATSQANNKPSGSVWGQVPKDVKLPTEEKETLWDKYVNGWSEDFANVKEANTTGEKIKEAGKSVLKRTHEGFKSMDNLNPLEYAKRPVRELADKIDKKVDDGNPENLSAGEKAWNAVKGVGKTVDFLTSAEGLAITGATIATGGLIGDAILGAAPQLAAAAPALNVTLGTAGVGVTGKGVYDVATAENEEEAQKGGAEILTGAIMTGGAAAGAKGSLDAARKAGVEAADPTTLTTGQAIKENFRVAGKGLKVSVGAKAPTMGAAIPASAIRMESKPNQVKAYQTTGEADGIVYRGSDGKLYVPNKWKPEQPYAVSDNSIIMIYDEAAGDFAVCDPKIFAKTYVRNTTGQYNAMKGVKPGEIIDATKKAVGGVEFVQEGTVVKTLEGPRTVQAGEAVCYDVDGNPYVSPIDNILKRNIVDEDLFYSKYAKFNNLTMEGYSNVDGLSNGNASALIMRTDKTRTGTFIMQATTEAEEPLKFLGNIGKLHRNFTKSGMTPEQYALSGQSRFGILGDDNHFIELLKAFQ